MTRQTETAAQSQRKSNAAAQLDASDPTPVTAADFAATLDALTTAEHAARLADDTARSLIDIAEDFRARDLTPTEKTAAHAAARRWFEQTYTTHAEAAADFAADAQTHAARRVEADRAAHAAEADATRHAAQEAQAAADTAAAEVAQILDQYVDALTADPATRTEVTRRLAAADAAALTADRTARAARQAARIASSRLYRRNQDRNRPAIL